MDKARAKLQSKCDNFIGSVKITHGKATNQLTLYRNQFLEKLDPLFASSVEGVKNITGAWRVLNWATLRAIVSRNGVFKSPTTGKSFDLNEDLAEPLLKQLPLSWERYFTDELGRVTDDFVLQLKESTKGYCEQIRLIIELLFNQTDDSIEKQLDWFQDKVSTLAKSAQNEVLSAVRERRTELAANMSSVAKQRMQRAYDAAKDEKGRGMKQRMLGHLIPVAIESAPPLYSTIRTDLLQGLNDLEIIIVGMLRKLAQAAEDHATNVVHNANIDVDESSKDPLVAGLLASAPRFPEIAEEPAPGCVSV
jgi:phosphopantetheine adenylyltransferase